MIIKGLIFVLMEKSISSSESEMTVNFWGSIIQKDDSGPPICSLVFWKIYIHFAMRRRFKN